MEERDYILTSEYRVDTGWCKSEKSVLGKINFGEIDNFLERENLNRDVKAEVLDLMDIVECVFGPKAEAFKDGIRVYRDKLKGWKITMLL